MVSRFNGLLDCLEAALTELQEHVLEPLSQDTCLDKLGLYRLQHSLSRFKLRSADEDLPKDELAEQEDKFGEFKQHLEEVRFTHLREFLGRVVRELAYEYVLCELSASTSNQLSSPGSFASRNFIEPTWIRTRLKCHLLSARILANVSNRLHFK